MQIPQPDLRIIPRKPKTNSQKTNKKGAGAQHQQTNTITTPAIVGWNTHQASKSRKDKT